MTPSITIQIPHEIEIMQGGVVPLQDFLDMLMIISRSAFNNISFADVHKIVKLENDSGHLTITLHTEVPEYVAHEFIKLWNLLEPSCEVEITVDTRRKS